MAPTFRDDPYPGLNFQVVINGVSDDGSSVAGAFAEVTGLDLELEAIDYRNGNEDITVRKIPGLKSFTNLTLKRGVIGDTALWLWIKEAMDGRVQRAEGSITLHDENQNEVMRWTFARGWPCKYSGPSLNATTNEIAMESLDICVEELLLDV